MEFIYHTIAWCKGEIFEGRLFFLFGLSILFLDHFSEERAETYHQQIVNYLK